MIVTISGYSYGLAFDPFNLGGRVWRPRVAGLVMLGWLFAGTTGWAARPDAVPGTARKALVVAHYAELMQAEYDDTLALAGELQTNIERLLAQPSGEHLAAARTAWIHCRTPYSQSEVGRFYGGPIDGIEGYINAWPIDENYLDYTVGMPDVGIINEARAFPVISSEVLLGANEREGAKTVSTGFHAIEFLLWGQDLYGDGPGRREYTDYVDGATGPGRTAARRRQYLHLLAELLVNQLRTVDLEWAPNNPHNYRARLLAQDPDAALTAIITGLGNLGSAELYGERLLVPYTTRSQENEESCFSDTTHLDLLNNELGFQNICEGGYQRVDGTRLSGPGLLALLEPKEPRLAKALRARVAAAVVAVRAIPAPFDQAMLGRDQDRGRVAIKQALGALQAQTAALVQAGDQLGLQVNLK